MRPLWDDVNARARGLGTELLGAAGLREISRLDNLADVGAVLARKGYPSPKAGRAVTPVALERVVRRFAQRQMKILARWCGNRSRYLALVFEDEDRRSVRALVRGAAASVSPEARLSGLFPTPALSERALGELARLSTPSEVAATLAVWQNPYGEAIRVETARPQLDLFRIETLLNRTYAGRALRAARSGGGDLRAIVREHIDLENALSAFVLGRHPSEVPAEESFLPGGARIDRATFLEAAETGSTRGLVESFTGTPYARAFLLDDIANLEMVLFRQRVGALVARARAEPLSVAPVLAFVARLRAEAIDLRHVIWSVALKAVRREEAPVWVSPR